MSPHKEGFTNKFEVTYPDLLSNLSDFEQRPSSNTLEHVTYMKEYKELVTAVLSTTGTRSQIVVNYLKDESAMLAILSICCLSIYLKLGPSLNIFKLKDKF